MTLKTQLIDAFKFAAAMMLSLCALAAIFMASIIGLSAAFAWALLAVGFSRHDAIFWSVYPAMGLFFFAAFFIGRLFEGRPKKGLK